MWGNIAIAFLLAFIVSFMATPYTIKIADKIGAVDIPKDKRRMHTKKMPKFGGTAVILGFLVSMIYLIMKITLHSLNAYMQSIRERRSVSCRSIRLVRISDTATTMAQADLTRIS